MSMQKSENPNRTAKIVEKPTAIKIHKWYNLLFLAEFIDKRYRLIIIDFDFFKDFELYADLESVS